MKSIQILSKKLTALVVKRSKLVQILVCRVKMYQKFGFYGKNVSKVWFSKSGRKFPVFM